MFAMQAMLKKGRFDGFLAACDEWEIKDKIKRYRKKGLKPYLKPFAVNNSCSEFTWKSR